MTLSQRIAALTGPDRAVDAEVAVAIDWRFDDWEEGDPTPKGMADKHGIDWLVRCMKSGASIWRHLPRFTASLDAARSSVPEGMRVRIDIMEDGRGGAWVYWPTEMPTGMTELRATPALALLAAAIKARGL